MTSTMSKLDVSIGVFAVSVAGLLAGCGNDGSDPSVPAEPSSRLDLGDNETIPPSAPDMPCQGVELRSLWPANARFEPGQIVEVVAELSVRDGLECTADVRLEMFQIGERIHEEVRTISVTPSTPTFETFSWDAPDEDFRGYIARLDSPVADSPRFTAVDVSSTPVRYPRYGYISVFPPGQTAQHSAQIIDTLAQHFHLNLFQFYDWFWRHEDLIPRQDDGTIEPVWTDLFGRENAWSTITDLVAAVHEQQAWAMAYVTIYGAREGYAERSSISPAWGLFAQPGAQAQVALDFGAGRFLFLFDPSNPQWQERMANEYVEAIEAGDFDGVHIDQFGPRPTYYTAEGEPIELRATFAPFLEAIDASLGERVPGRDACTFNLVEGAVDGYAVEEVATSGACDFLYSEIWFATDTYEALRAYIEQLRDIGGGRAVVLAVYAQYGEDVGTILQAEEAQLQGVEAADGNANFTGTGYITGFDEVGDAITWTVDVTEEALVSLVFRYANDAGQAATRTVLVDGDPIGMLPFRATAGADSWLFDAWIQTRLDEGRHTVSLVYGEGDTGTVAIDRLTLGEFDEASVRLQNAVIFASGATPIQVGDDVQSLWHEYFPNRSRTLSPSLQRALQRQYSFITGHEWLLFAPEVEPIPERLERIERVSEGPPLIAEGAGGIWTILRSTPAGDAIHLVNLVGVDNERWRDAAPVPETQHDLVLRYRISDPSSVREVLWATPDEDALVFEPLEFEVGEDFVQFEVPRLAYWDMVLVRR